LEYYCFSDRVAVCSPVDRVETLEDLVQHGHPRTRAHASPLGLQRQASLEKRQLRQAHGREQGRIHPGVFAGADVEVLREELLWPHVVEHGAVGFEEREELRVLRHVLE